MPTSPARPLPDPVNPPLVSVVIPVYQGARLIAATLDSVLAQTWPHLEIVVVDDGSTDATRDVVSAYASRGVRLLSASNGGAARARNLGCAASRGAFVQFLDHDDLLSPRKIELQMQRLLQQPGSVACGPWAPFEDDPQQAVHQHLRTYRDDDPLSWLVSVRGGDGMMPTGAWLTPRTLIETAGPWDESLERNPDDDGEFFSRVILASRRVLFCEDALFYYRNPTSHRNLRAGRSPRAVESLLLTQHRYRDRLLKAEDSERTRRAAAHGYAAFLEMIYPDFPTQCARAFSSLESLGEHGYLPPGSAKFGWLIRAVGLRTALRIRHAVRILRGHPRARSQTPARGGTDAAPGGAADVAGSARPGL